MRPIIKIFFLSLLLLLGLREINAQTIGAGEVSSIEAKAKQIEQNKIRIAQYKQQLISLDSAYKAKLQTLNIELQQLIKERDAIIDDMKKGAKCSQCGKYKSEFEKKGEDFVKHLGDVKGYAIPATTPELEATRQKYNERIALKRVQIQNYQKLDNPALAKQKQITDTELATQKLCTEITAHSKSYDTRVFEEAKNKNNQWAQNLLTYVSPQLIAEDKVAIYKDHAQRFQDEYNHKTDSIKQAVREKVDEEKKNKSSQVLANDVEIVTLKRDLENYLSGINPKLNTLKTEKIKVDLMLKKPGIKDSVKQVLQIQLTDLVKEITVIEKDILNNKQITKNKVTALESKNAMLKKIIWDLTVNLPKLEEAELNTIKPYYTKIIADAQNGAVKSAADLVTAKATYKSKIIEFENSQRAYAQVMDKEVNRMLTAAQSVSCSIYNEVRGKSTANWNEQLNCVQNVAASAKASTYNVFNAYCTKDFSQGSGLSAYKSFINNLSPEDKAVVKKISNLNWFESLN